MPSEVGVGDTARDKTGVYRPHGGHRPVRRTGTIKESRRNRWDAQVTWWVGEKCGGGSPRWTGK